MTSLVASRTPLTSHQPRAVWPSSIFFALAGSLTEVVVLVVRRLCFGETLVLSPQFVWMIPLVTVVLSGGLGLFLTCIAGWLPKTSVHSITIFALAYLALLGPLFAVPRLHYLAILILAA